MTRAPDRTRRRLVLASLALALLVSVLVWRAMHRPDMPTFTAWESRVEGEAIIVGTAAVLGLETQPDHFTVLPALTCTLPDESDGHEFELRGLEHRIEGDALYPGPTLDTWKAQVRAHWSSLGLEPQDFSRGDKRVVVITVADGGEIAFLAGPVGFTLYGYSGCAVTEGTEPPSAAAPSP